MSGYEYLIGFILGFVACLSLVALTCWVICKVAELQQRIEEERWG